MKNKKIIIGIAILVVLIALLAGLYFISVYKPEIQKKKQLLQRFSEFKAQCDEKKAQGYDVTEAEVLARRAKRAFDRKDYKTADNLLDSAFEALERAKKIPVMPEEVKEEAKKRFSQIKVASLYERITDNVRNIDEVITIFKETETDFIFRGWWIWYPCPESPETVLPPDYPSDYVKICAERGYTYQQFREALSEIKKEMPNVIFCGAVPAERINFNFLEIDPMTGEIYKKEGIEEMALDPAKWGITSVSKDKLQKHFQEGATSPGGYFPDITNSDFQELFMSWVKKQIDCGVDAIWIDMLFSQARILNEITGDPYHPAVKESYEAASKIVDEIHDYGYLKGKYIYVGTWLDCIEFPYPPPNLDFITVSPSSDEISAMKLEEEKWDEIVKKIREKMGDIPIFAFMDWSTSDSSPMAIFSQKLTIEEQRKFLKIADDFFQKKGIIFVYPVHGGWMGNNAKILSFGKSKFYDSKAPEFNTYETIKELAQNKSKH